MHEQKYPWLQKKPRAMHSIPSNEMNTAVIAAMEAISMATKPKPDKIEKQHKMTNLLHEHSRSEIISHVVESVAKYIESPTSKT